MLVGEGDSIEDVLRPIDFRRMGEPWLCLSSIEIFQRRSGDVRQRITVGCVLLGFIIAFAPAEYYG